MSWTDEIEVNKQNLTDSLGKVWSVHLIAEGESLILGVEGYDNVYPLELAKDRKFSIGANVLLRRLGYNGIEAELFSLKTAEDQLVFGVTEELNTFISRNRGALV